MMNVVMNCWAKWAETEGTHRTRLGELRLQVYFTRTQTEVSHRWFAK